MLKFLGRLSSENLSIIAHVVGSGVGEGKGSLRLQCSYFKDTFKLQLLHEWGLFNTAVYVVYKLSPYLKHLVHLDV